MNFRDVVTLSVLDKSGNALLSKPAPWRLHYSVESIRHVALKHFICARKRPDWRVKPSSLLFEQLLGVKELELY